MRVKYVLLQQHIARLRLAPVQKSARVVAWEFANARLHEPSWSPIGVERNHGTESSVDIERANSLVHAKQPLRRWKLVVIDDADEVASSQSKRMVPRCGDGTLGFDVIGDIKLEFGLESGHLVLSVTSCVVVHDDD